MDLDTAHEVLRILFRSALQQVGSRPIQLRHFSIDADNMAMCWRVTASFREYGTAGPDLHHQQSIPMQARRDRHLPAITLGDWTQLADNMWRREYERHYVRSISDFMQRLAQAHGNRDMEFRLLHTREPFEDRLLQLHRRGPERHIVQQRLAHHEAHIWELPPLEHGVYRETQAEAQTRLASQIERMVFDTLGMAPAPQLETIYNFDDLRQAARALATHPVHDSLARLMRPRPPPRQEEYRAWGHETVINFRGEYAVLTQGEHLAQLQRMQEAQDRVVKERKEARERGMALLNANLTPKQQSSLERYRHFDVKGGTSGKTYRITYGSHMNVFELTKLGRKKCGWCFLPRGALCEGDVMLAQKISLELDEEHALEIANRFKA